VRGTASRFAAPPTPGTDFVRATRTHKGRGKK
jgi:hypothetical protein